MLKVIDPATEELLAELEEEDASTLARKAATARAAQPAWARLPLAERLAALRRFGELLHSRRESLAMTLTREVGKPIRQSRGELTAMQPRLDFFLQHTARAIEDEVVLPATDSSGMEERIRYEPLGVIASISAWNYPYFVGSNVFVPALLAGNAVLYKPSEYATLSGLAMAKLLHEAEVPEEVFVPIVGAGGTGRVLLEQDVDAVCFTGSYATGRRVAEEAARRLRRVQLELGGKDPAYVCDDVDVEVAAAALVEGAFYNSGQSCCAVERIYVHRPSPAPSSARLWRRRVRSSSVIRRTNEPISAPWRDPPSSACSSPRLPTRSGTVPGWSSAAAAGPAVATTLSPPFSPRPTIG